MASVTLSKIDKIYPGEGKKPSFHAVKGIDLEIKEGEFMVLVGPSGCAKSTTLRMIAGLEDISGGEMRIGDKRVNELPPKKRDIAMVFQNYALYPHMTVFENMAFGLKLKKRSKAEIKEKVEEAAKILGLEELLDRHPKALSGGQRQRVAVGRSIVRNPKVFLFDEPLSNLDAKMRISMRSEITQLHKRLGATMIYVTHDQTEAMTMGDRITVMKLGEIQQVATPLELYRNPANQFVAGFIGSPPMNFLPGNLIASENGVTFSEPNGSTLHLPNNTIVGEDITLGVRPEHWQINSTDEGLEVTIDFIEPMGSETLVHAKTKAGTAIVIRVDGDREITEGSTHHLVPQDGKAYFFDKEGERIQG